MAREPGPQKPSDRTTQQAHEAQDRLRKGESLDQLPKAMQRAYGAYQDYVRANTAWEWMRAVPKQLFYDLAGSAPKVVGEQAERYGMPVHDRQPVDLHAFVRWAFEFVTKNSRRLTQHIDDDPLMSGSGSPALERYRAAKAEAAERDNAVAKRDLLPTALVRECHEVFAKRLRWFHERLRVEYGNTAAERFEAVLREAGKDVETLIYGEEKKAGQ